MFPEIEPESEWGFQRIAQLLINYCPELLPEGVRNIQVSDYKSEKYQERRAADYVEGLTKCGLLKSYEQDIPVKNINSWADDSGLVSSVPFPNSPKPIQSKKIFVKGKDLLDFINNSIKATGALEQSTTQTQIMQSKEHQEAADFGAEQASRGFFFFDGELYVGHETAALWLTENFLAAGYGKGEFHDKWFSNYIEKLRNAAVCGQITRVFEVNGGKPDEVIGESREKIISKMKCFFYAEDIEQWARNKDKLKLSLSFADTCVEACEMADFLAIKSQYHPIQVQVTPDTESKNTPTTKPEQPPVQISIAPEPKPRSGDTESQKAWIVWYITEYKKRSMDEEFERSFKADMKKAAKEHGVGESVIDKRWREMGLKGFDTRKGMKN